MDRGRGTSSKNRPQTILYCLPELRHLSSGQSNSRHHSVSHVRHMTFAKMFVRIRSFRASAQMTLVRAELTPNSSAARDAYFWGSAPSEGQAIIFRVRVSDRNLERVVSLATFRRAVGMARNWVGLASDDSPMLVRDAGTQDIYALDVQ